MYQKENPFTHPNITEFEKNKLRRKPNPSYFTSNGSTSFRYSNITQLSSSSSLQNPHNTSLTIPKTSESRNLHKRKTTEKIKQEVIDAVASKK